MTKAEIQELQKAAEQGDAVAQFNLGVLYYKGEGVPQDYKEAFKWHLKAAEQGYADAQTNLGITYYAGLGVPKNTATAYAWYNVAAENGSEGASGMRDIAATEMTPEQLAKAQELSKVWVEKFQPKK